MKGPGHPGVPADSLTTGDSESRGPQRDSCYDRETFLTTLSSKSLLGACQSRSTGEVE